MKELEEFKNWLRVLGYNSQIQKQYPRFTERIFQRTESTPKTITKAKLSDYFDHEKHRKFRGKQLSGNYINKQLSAIRTFSRFTSMQYGFRLPVDHLLYVRIPCVIPSVLTLSEIQQLYDATDTTIFGSRDRVMLGMCYGAGLRRNEAIKLHVKDIDLRAGYVFVRNGKNNKDRIVPIPQQIINEVRVYLKNARPILQNNKKLQRELFLGYRGNPLTSQVFEKQIKVLVRRTANQSLIAKEPTLHTLRHSIATHLLNAGVPLRQVSQFLGHASLASTQVYTHITTDTS